MRWTLTIVLFVLLSSVCGHFEPDALIKLYSDCSRKDWTSCLKMKLLSGLEKMRSMDTIPVMNGISFVDENFELSAKERKTQFTESALEMGLPRSVGDRNEVLDSLLLDELLLILSKYTLRVKLSSFRYPIEQARGKGKKHMMMMPLMMAATFIPIALMTLAILAGKALIVGKIALLLSGILGIKKLFNHDHDDDEHQRAMKRIGDFEMKMKSDMAQRMAYKMAMMNDLPTMS